VVNEITGKQKSILPNFPICCVQEEAREGRKEYIVSNFAVHHAQNEIR
jgi:hypothetical protein